MKTYTFGEIIGLWPSIADLARDLEVPYGVVKQWKRRDSIPSDRWLSIVAAAGSRGISLTLDRLAQAADAGGRLPARQDTMSEERITLELLGARMLALTAEVRDLQQRFTGLETRLAALETRFSAMETRFSAMETRFAAQEERMTRMLALLVRVAERLDGPRE